jgi:trans-aconitate 2-methyltransferase
MRRWAQRVIDDLELNGDETVLDAGCGSGSVTFDLRQRLPRGRIYAVDASAEMVEALRARVAAEGAGNVVPVQASLTDFTLPEAVDAVFSNAVFHWITDDEALFGCLFRATKPGGRLRAQCGGYGNNAAVLASVEKVRADARFARHLGDFRDSKKYRREDEAAAALERAGWRDVRARLWPEAVPFDDEREAALYVRTILLRDHVARLPEEFADEYCLAVVRETVRRRGTPYAADYVRLDLWANRPAGV